MFDVYRNPDLLDKIFDSLLAAMAKGQSEVRKGFFCLLATLLIMRSGVDLLQ